MQKGINYKMACLVMVVMINQTFVGTSHSLSVFAADHVATGLVTFKVIFIMMILRVCDHS